MKRIEVNEGDVYGMLTVIKESDPNIQPTGRNERVFLCQCDCGKTARVQLNNLRSGHTYSCGCVIGEKHNSTETDLYVKWTTMKRRCYNPNAYSSKYYYEKGIKMCNEWRNSFTAFKEWSLRNGYNESLSIDRIDSNGNYEPSNCMWIEMSENRAKDSRKENIIYDGKKYSLDLLLKELGRSSEYKRIYHRIWRGWPVDKAINHPFPQLF